jgi:hypothetical protein
VTWVVREATVVDQIVQALLVVWSGLLTDHPQMGEMAPSEALEEIMRLIGVLGEPYVLKAVCGSLGCPCLPKVVHVLS